MAEDINALKPPKKETGENVNSLQPKIPTINEILADLGDPDRRAKYQSFLDGGKLNRKDRTPLTQTSLYLLGMANRSPNPERYLESLSAAYGGSQLKFDIRQNPLVRGLVNPDRPNIGEVYDLSIGENTIPHELEHTLQLNAKANPRGEPLNFGESSIARGNRGFQFGELLRREREMPQEQRDTVFPSGNYRDNDREFNANIAAYALRVNARGEDFINTPEGRALFPDEKSQKYYYQNILPQVTSAYGFASNENRKPFQPRNPNESYANKLVRNVKNFLR
jgi:hypothetical protein